MESRVRLKDAIEKDGNICGRDLNLDVISAVGR
jgi:hypothetical protein